MRDIISTITLNPAIDKTVYIDEFTIDNVNIVQRETRHVGSKGVNVSQIINKFGIKTICSGFGGGENGLFMKQKLENVGIATDFVETDYNTRENFKVVDSKNGTYTDINFKGGEPTDKNVEDMLRKTAELAKKSKFVCIGGSVPPNMGKDIYKKMIQIVKENGAYATIDCGGEELSYAIEARPYIIKPNKHELELMLGVKIKDNTQIYPIIMNLIESGIDHVLISMGSEGAICGARGSGIFKVMPINVDVKGTVGAGDSFLSGYLYAINKDIPPNLALAFASSFSTAKITCEGTEIPNSDALIAYIDKANIINICPWVQ